MYFNIFQVDVNVAMGAHRDIMSRGLFVPLAKLMLNKEADTVAAEQIKQEFNQLILSSVLLL